MAQEPDVIRQEIEETRSSLTEKLETLEAEVKGTVQNAKETVEETIETAKTAVQNTIESVKEGVHGTVETVKESLDVGSHTRHYPWAMFGGAVATGFAVGLLLPGRERLQRMGRQMPRATRHGGIATSAVTPATPATSAPAAAAPQGPGFFSGLLHQFDDELGKLKGVAIGAAMGLVRDLVRQSVPPNLAPRLEEVVNDITSKLGGEPVRGPILRDTPTAERGYAHSATTAPRM